MLIYVFPPHYQLVYISFDISSFSVISYIVKAHLSHGDSYVIGNQLIIKRNLFNALESLLQWLM